MEESRRTYSKKRRNPQSNRKGGTKKGRWQNSTREPSAKKSNAPETSYRILCQSVRTGSVIGKGGGRVKALRDETQAKITVADSVPGCDERVITVLSPSAQMPRKSNAGNDDEDLNAHNDDNGMEPLCAAQDALMKVHERIIEEDIDGAENGDKNEVTVTARLLVPNNTVGCLLGRKGDVIQKLRKETEASIRVLSIEDLPRCAFNTDELVQISGKPALVKKALYEISTLLHQNPRKDEPPPESFPLAYGTRNSHPAGPPLANISPPGNLPWPPHNRSEHTIFAPLTGRYGNQQAGVGPRDFDGFPLPIGGESPREFSLKILCSNAKIGGVIGKGGSLLRELQHGTGARIHVEDNSPDSDERVIFVSAVEALGNPRSQTIDTILHLQNIVSEHSDKGTITTRLLVPSSKVGCILGQGGHLINEMRRRTQADIRVLSKKDKPKCASSGEELVQISGKFAVAKDALVEVGLRLRSRILRDADAKGEPAPLQPEPVTSRTFQAGVPSPYGAIGAGSSGRHEDYNVGIREYDPPTFQGPSSAMSHSNHNWSDMRISNNPAAPPIHGSGGAIMNVIDESRRRPPDLPLSNPGQTFQTYGALPVQMNPQRDPYQNIVSEQSSYHPQRDPYQNIVSEQSSYHPQRDPYQNIVSEQSSYHPQRDPYQNIVSEQSSYHPQRDPYQNIVSKQSSYHPERDPYHNIVSEQSSYQNINVSENPYQSFNAPQAPPQNISAEQAHYHNPSLQGSFHY